MKRFFFHLTLMFVSLTSFATGQEGDVIFIDGRQWELLGKPIYADSILSRELKAALPEGRGHVSSNWAGYTAYWSIQQGQLYLDSVKYGVYNPDIKQSRMENLPKKVLRRVFKNYVKGKRILASWYNNDIRVARGEMLYYQHTGFERNYENERIISIMQGKVGETKEYHNYVVEGFAFEDYRSRPKFNQSGDDLREKFPLHIEQHPELADVKRIMFHIKKARVDAQGRLVECEVRVVKPGDNPRLAAEMAEVLKAYHPWRVFFINGEYRAYGIEGYVFPYLLKNKE